MVFGLGFALLVMASPFIVVGAVVSAVLAAQRRDAERDAAAGRTDEGIGTIRRVFLYGIASISLVLLAIGLSLLVTGTIDALIGDTVIAGRDTQLATALALTVVGGPAWLIFMLLAQRSIAREPAEGRSQARRLYIDVVRAVSMLVVIVSAILAGLMLLGVEEFGGGPWGWLVTWAFVWALHHRFALEHPAESEATSLFDRLYYYLIAIVGLYLLGGGAMATIGIPLSWAYDRVFRDSLVESGWAEDVQTAAMVMLIGAAAWAFHWLLTLSRRDARSTMWFGYLFLFGVTTAVFATLVPLAALLYTALEWWLGAPTALNAAEQFDSVPIALAVALVGVLSWGYHRAALREGAPLQAAWSEPERIYRYLVAGAGLLTMAAGITTLLAVTFDAIAQQSGDLLGTSGWAQNAIVLGVTLLLVGVPLWARYWFQAQAEATRHGAPERSATPRRVFLFAVFGLAVAVALIDLTIVVYQLFEAIINGTLGLSILGDTNWNIALVLVAGAVGGYYWLVLREDQQMAPAENDVESAAAPASASPVRRREVIVIGGPDAATLVRRIDTIEGVTARRWQRMDDVNAMIGTLDDAAFEVLRGRIATAATGRLLVIVRDGTLDLIPFEER